MNNHPILKKILLVLISFLFVWCIVEISVILYTGRMNNWIIVQGGGLIKHHGLKLFSFNSDLGWSPASHTSFKKWDKTIYLLDDGIRSNGRKQNIQGVPDILAVGDSFTFCNEVADKETWPSLLEEMGDHKVLNAGVPAYGFDQIILRSELLLNKYHPHILIVSFIPDDVIRCSETVRHGLSKPYFEIEDRKLVKKNSPVPYRKNFNLDTFRSVSGHSFLFHKMMSVVSPKYWYSGTLFDIQRIDNQPFEIAKLLVDRLENDIRGKNIRVVFLVQAPWHINKHQMEQTASLIAHIEGKKNDNIRILNLASQLLDVKERDPLEFNSYFHQKWIRHMSYKGNLFIADHVRDFIMKRSGVSYW